MIFSLETASDYVKDEKACFFGFKCMIVGYEWNDLLENVSLQLYTGVVGLLVKCCVTNFSHSFQFM